MQNLVVQYYILYVQYFHMAIWTESKEAAKSEEAAGSRGCVLVIRALKL